MVDYARFQCKVCKRSFGWSGLTGCFTCGLCSDCLDRKEGR